MKACPCDLACVGIIVATAVLIVAWWLTVAIWIIVVASDRKRRVDRFRATQKILERIARTR